MTSPRTIVSDNGTELTLRAILGWQQDHGVEWHYIASDKPSATHLGGSIELVSDTDANASARHSPPKSSTRASLTA
jgi:hypothetical protein